jgi:hypothetical protein
MLAVSGKPVLAVAAHDYLIFFYFGHIALQKLLDDTKPLEHLQNNEDTQSEKSQVGCDNQQTNNQNW